MSHVDVTWVGLECRQRQESPSDQVMGHVIMINRATGESVTHKFPGDRETWNMGRPDERIVNVQVPLYSGPPVPLVVETHLVEHDSTASDIELYKRRTREAVADIANAAIASGTGIALPALNEIVKDLSRALVNAVTDLIGASDDPYNPSGVALDTNILSNPNRPHLTAERGDDPKRINYTPLTRETEFITVTGRDDGGDVGEYRFYFDVRVSDAPDQPATAPGSAGEPTTTPPTQPDGGSSGGNGAPKPPTPDGGITGGVDKTVIEP